MSDDVQHTEGRIEQKCWIEGCTHTYEAKNLNNLTAAVLMHLDSDHRGTVEELVYLE